MEDRANADNFTERRGEGRAGFPERCRPRIIDRRPTPVRTDARRSGRAARWLQGDSLVSSRGLRGLPLVHPLCAGRYVPEGSVSTILPGSVGTKQEGPARTLAGQR
jgi:hypothetical protein